MVLITLVVLVLLLKLVMIYFPAVVEVLVMMGLAKEVTIKAVAVI